jgi:protease-4
LNDDIEEAEKMADLKEFGIKKFTRYKTGIERLMEDMGGVSASAKKSLIEEEIGVEAYGILKQVKSAMEQKGIQARMPFALDIK